MITKKDIIQWSKPHFSKGRRTQIENDNIVVSIVGGTNGLYGDFDKDFEVAILEKDTNNFVTKYFVPESTDDVLAYYSADDLVNLLNRLFSNRFRVRK